MKITVKQNQDFEDAIASRGMQLPTAIEWIRENLRPEQVFSLYALAEWADHNYES